MTDPTTDPVTDPTTEPAGEPPIAPVLSEDELDRIVPLGAPSADAPSS